MKQYETFELVLQGPELESDYAQVPLTAEFRCAGKTRRVKGFYDGEGRYAVRFLPLSPGEYAYTVSGPVEAEGHELCEPARGARGPVRAVGTSFACADGKPFLPFGTTVYALASQEDALVERTLKTLGESPFNKLRMCVFPKSYAYNANEPPCYPFARDPSGKWDVHRPCIPFWRRFERILDRVGELGIQIDLILFHPYDRWGFSRMSREEDLVYLDYLLRRLSAKPWLWWSLANEYDLCDGKTLEDWETLEEFVASEDPYGHLLSCHNCFCFWDHSRSNITHASLQTKALTELPRWRKTWNKPVMIDECCYEGDIGEFWGSISGREMVNRFWQAAVGGGYCTHGETFLDEEDVLWWSKGGELKGKSPRRIAFLKRLLEELPGPLEPTASLFEELSELPGPEAERRIAEATAALPEDYRRFMGMLGKSLTRMPEREKHLHLAAEHTYSAHCGERAYLWFCGRQCYSRLRLDLPEKHRYRVEAIDTWEMTRLLADNAASGPTEIRLPGKEGMAVLALRIG